MREAAYILAVRACRRSDAGADLSVAADGYSRQRHRAQRMGALRADILRVLWRSGKPATLKRTGRSAQGRRQSRCGRRLSSAGKRILLRSWPTFRPMVARAIYTTIWYGSPKQDPTNCAAPGSPPRDSTHAFALASNPIRSSSSMPDATSPIGSPLARPPTGPPASPFSPIRFRRWWPQPSSPKSGVCCPSEDIIYFKSTRRTFRTVRAAVRLRSVLAPRWSRVSR